MADTLQAVSWSLDQTCGLRSAETLAAPWKAQAAVADAQTYARSSARKPPDPFAIYSGICVTTHHNLREVGTNLYRGVRAPAAGLIIADAFKEIGGVDGLDAMCRTCPANTTTPTPAGCCGWFFLSPEKQRLEHVLQRTLSSEGLADRYHRAFLPTTPIWYGLWTSSPLSSEQLFILRRLIGAIVKLPEGRYSGFPLRGEVRDLHPFLQAIERAEKDQLHLHVRLASPGHTDFGQLTTFAHCPVCKAAADRTNEWKIWEAADRVICRVCGNNYAPEATAASESMGDENFDLDRLKNELSAERYRNLVFEYAAAAGHTRDEIEACLAYEAECEAKAAPERQAAKEREETEQQFFEKVLFAGITLILTHIYPRCCVSRP